MNPDTTVSLSLLISTISAIGVIYAIVRGRKGDTELEKQRAVDMATNFAKIDVKLTELNAKTSETNKTMEKLDEKIDTMNDRMSRQDERINTLYNYYDQVMKRIDKLEGK